MTKYLVIIEGPGKIKKVSAALGKDYKVVATKGHCVDLPSKGINISINKDKQTGDYTFTPNYKVLDDKKDLVSDLADLASKHQITYLMTDSDREGEAIAWHIANQLPSSAYVVRAVTNSITKSEIAKAINNSRSINIDLVNSYEARRMLDRIVGYKCSFLTTTATGGKSVGRVQSAALRILAEREQDIQNFVPQEYWEIKANIETKNKEEFTADLLYPKALDIKNKSEADKIKKYLKGNTAKVVLYDTKRKSNKAYPPFTTSTMQQSAVSILGMSQSRAMKAAQKLYEDGLCTYHRTDSVSISSDGLKNIRNYIQSNFSSSYLPSKANVYKTSSQNAQEAHEAIRPTDTNILSGGSDADQRKLYDLIWRRAVASQMTNSVSDHTSLRLQCDTYKLGATGSVLIFDGWKNVWTYALSQDVILPLLDVDDEVDISDVTAKQKFTQPPPRFTEASITKELEKTGIGRPSTYEQTLRTLKDREYVEIKKKSFHVTNLGLRVSDFLKKANFCFIDLQFTANMESDLDKISEVAESKENILNSFYKRLLTDINNGEQVKQSDRHTQINCPDCSELLLMKYNRQGVPFFACPDRESCGFTSNVGDDGLPKQNKPEELVYSSYDCPVCGSKMVQRKSRYGNYFYGCSQFSTKGCRGIRDENGQVKDEKKKKKKKTKKKTKKKAGKRK